MSTPVSRYQLRPKFKPRWFRSFEVLRDLGSTVQLKFPATCRANPAFNTTAFKHYNKDTINSAPPPPLPIIDRDGNEPFIVESILSQRLFPRQKQFLVNGKVTRNRHGNRLVTFLMNLAHQLCPVRNFSIPDFGRGVV